MPADLDVPHGAGSYPVRLRPGGLRDLAAAVAAAAPGCRPATITDTNVALAAAAWTGPLPGEAFTVPPGEASKSREVWAGLTDRLLASGFGRDSVIVALGGGVVGDLAGFVAATLHRGLPLVQAPTSLLAMIDASVGGKVGLDTPAGKNLVGAFHPPVLVLADPLALHTLPGADYRAGLAEAVKHGVAMDAAYFGWIEASVDAILARDPDTVARLVRRSIELKAAVVERDERESGERAVLNAGHTVGHAVEAAAGFRIRHGEAVAAGLVAEIRLAEAMGVAGAGTADRVATLLRRLGLPDALPDGLAVGSLLQAMGSDKKNRGGRLHLVLVSAVGQTARDGASWTVPVAPELIAKILS